MLRPSCIEGGADSVKTVRERRSIRRLRDQQDIADVIATARASGASLDLTLMQRWAAVWEVEDRLEIAFAEP